MPGGSCSFRPRTGVGAATEADPAGSGRFMPRRVRLGAGRGRNGVRQQARAYSEDHVVGLRPPAAARGNGSIALRTGRSSAFLQVTGDRRNAGAFTGFSSGIHVRLTESWYTPGNA